MDINNNNLLKKKLFHKLTHKIMIIHNLTKITILEEIQEIQILRNHPEDLKIVLQSFVYNLPKRALIKHLKALIFV